MSTRFDQVQASPDVWARSMKDSTSARPSHTTYPASVDWRRVGPDDAPASAVDPVRRMRVLGLVFAVLLAAVFARVVALEWGYGEAFRAEAQRPVERRYAVPAERGRILAADGTVLACDEQVAAVAVSYRWLENPANPRWLARLARGRTPRSQWREPGRLEAAAAEVLDQREALHARLASLCGLAVADFAARAEAIQTRVQRISQGVNQRRQALAAAQRQSSLPPDDAAWWQQAVRAVADALTAADDQPPPEHITIAEELDAHVIAEDVPEDVVREIETRPDLYPGTRIVRLTRRRYPQGPLAAHVVGHLGLADQRELHDGAALQPTDRVGRLGAERQHEAVLRGRSGTAVEQTDHGGRLLRTLRQREPAAGSDVVLTLDLELQRHAEALLDAAVAQAAGRSAPAPPASRGGAIVVLDVESGAVRAAASAPRFDPNHLGGAAPSSAAQLLADPGQPLFDRAVRMAIPPGSVFKTLTAIALLEENIVQPEEPFFCQGYLRQPDRLRCQVFRQWNVGHGPTTLDSALAWSCNVYFFHHATTLGPEALVRWARRSGFGEPTGIDLPGESAGSLPSPGTQLDWSPADTQALAIGQGGLQATPLQVVRLMAAIANGGRLVTPHLVQGEHPTTRLLHDGSTLAAVRRGLERVVADPEGTANRTVYLDSVAIAGKTGTAQTGGGRADHAWFAGYAPADKPRVAFVVVLEHAGGGAEAAGPLARALIARLLGERGASAP